MAVVQIVYAVFFKHLKHQGLEKKISFYQFFLYRYMYTYFIYVCVYIII